MNSNTVFRVFRAIIGLVLMVTLTFTVMKWWGEYKVARTVAQVSEATSSAGSTGSAEATGGAKSTAGIKLQVKTDGLNFRAKPSPDAKPIRGLKKGEVVTVVQKQETWYQVSDKDGVKGWISSSSSYTKVVK